MRVQMLCDQCGKVDDHPKVHVEPDGVFHHDCLSAKFRAQIVESSEHGKSIVEAAESGTHGNDLLSHIENLHQNSGV